MNIILRGDTFRDCTMDVQLEAYKSIIKHVINPLNYKLGDINVIVVTYNNKHENYIKDIFKDYNYFFFIINKKDQIENYINTLNKIPDFLINYSSNMLILRSDLYFKEDIDYSRTGNDKILVQWNLLTYTKSRNTVKQIDTHLLFDLSVMNINNNLNNFWYGCPDQIQFIGSQNVKKFINKMNYEYKKNVFLPGSLHDLLDFFVNHFDVENISYLNYIENPRPDSNRCFISGNPLPKPPLWFGNNIYNYTRYIK